VAAAREQADISLLERSIERTRQPEPKRKLHPRMVSGLQRKPLGYKSLGKEVQLPSRAAVRLLILRDGSVRLNNKRLPAYFEPILFKLG